MTRKIRVSVGTANFCKIAAVQRVCDELFGECEVISVDVCSASFTVA